MSALGIVHAQGLVHGQLTSNAVLTEGEDEPDFQLGGFEWSLWLSADLAEKSHARVGPTAAVKRAESYSFAADWRALGLMAVECLDAEVRASGEIHPRQGSESPIALHVPERVLLKRLIAPARMDQLDADSIVRAIDDLIASVSRSASARAGSFVLTFDRQSKLGEAVYDATHGEIPVDEYRRQLDWARGDIDGGATLLVPRAFDPASTWLRLVTENAVYKLRAFRDEGAVVWDVAVCQAVELRDGAFSLGDTDEHAVLQPVIIVANSREAQETRGRLGPDALDWSAFANPTRDAGSATEGDAIRRALLLVQVVEAVVKALEVYPVQILDSGRQDGRRYVVLRAEPNNDRDRVAKRVGLLESASALKRLFEEEHQDAEAKWRLSQAASLGATRTNDVVATFVDVVDHRGRRGYRFETDEELPEEGPFFLRTERDTGTEQVIARRLRNIKALDTRVDLAEMLADPWRVRRSSREALSDDERKDAAFLDLDKPKQDALAGLWSILPSFFVVGPPGVGKTKLATEVVRRRFVADRSTRMLVSAQGHDALDNLQEKIKETLLAASLDDVLVVRSTTSERRPTSDEEVHRAGLDYLDRLSRSALARDAPASTRARIAVLKDAAGRLEAAKETVDRDQRSGLGAVSHLVLDADVAVAVQRLVGRRGLADDIATEMAITARDLRRGPAPGGSARIAVVVGDHHDRLIRVASSAAQRKFVVGSNRLGSTARPGALMQGEVAGGRAGVTATVLYTQTTGPLKNRHARALAEEARPNGLTLTKTKKIPLHGKFVAWDEDDLVVTSLNWASASADIDFPWGEIGVHVHAPSVASAALARLEAIFPELTAAPAAAEVS